MAGGALMPRDKGCPTCLRVYTHRQAGVSGLPAEGDPGVSPANSYVAGRRPAPQLRVNSHFTKRSLEKKFEKNFGRANSMKNNDSRKMNGGSKR